MGRSRYLDLRLRERGHSAARNWEVTKVVIHDPTGTSWEPAPYPQRSQGDQVRISLGDLLLPDEPAYRVQIELVRRGREQRRVEFLTHATRRAGKPYGATRADPE